MKRLPYEFLPIVIVDFDLIKIYKEPQVFVDEGC